MILFLDEDPSKSCEMYDDITLTYSMQHAIAMFAAVAYEKKLDVNEFLIGNTQVTELPCAWMQHSIAAWDWMFKYTVHCVAEYYHRTSLPVPMYTTLLQTIKDNREVLTQGMPDTDIQWWPLSDPRETHDIVKFNFPHNQWSPVKFFPLLRKVHEMHYQSLSDNMPNMRWTKRSQPHWLNRF